MSKNRSSSAILIHDGNDVIMDESCIIARAPGGAKSVDTMCLRRFEKLAVSKDIERPIVGAGTDVEHAQDTVEEIVMRAR